MLLITVTLIGMFGLGMASLAYLLGFRMGRENNAHEFFRVREESLLAQRQILQTTRDAFREIVDHVERTRGNQ